MKKISKKSSIRRLTRARKKQRIRKKIKAHIGTTPRLVVFRSNKFLYAQVIDDGKSHTIVQANTFEKDFKATKSRKNLEAAKALGKIIGQRAKEQKVEKVLFDRNGYDYHGRVQAIADGAREAGLKF